MAKTYNVTDPSNGTGYYITPGMADASGALQNILNAVPQDSTLYFPGGVYNIGSPVTVPVKGTSGGASYSSITLKGDRDATIFQSLNSQTDSLLVVNSMFVTIEGFKFLGFANGTKTYKGIRFGKNAAVGGTSSARWCVVKDCRFENFVKGIHGSDSENINILNNDFNACTTAVHFIDNGMGSRIRDNVIQGGGPCILIERTQSGSGGSPLGQQAEGVHISGNEIYATGGSGIVIRGGLWHIIDDNMIGEVTDYANGAPAYAVELDGRNLRPVVCVTLSNNWFGTAWENNSVFPPTGPKASGMVLMAGVVYRTNIVNNTLQGSKAYGIQQDNADIKDTVIDGNDFEYFVVADISNYNAYRNRYVNNRFSKYQTGNWSIIEHTAVNSFVEGNSFPKNRTRTFGASTHVGFNWYYAGQEA